MIRITTLVAAFALAGLHAQEAPREPAGEPPAIPTENPDIPDDGVRVSVLGYHEFSEEKPETEMRIRTSKFRTQMETLRQLGIPVISMDDFAAWRRGDKELPEHCVLITLDDGWKSVYTDAFPILREMGYPFTLYLYKNYVDGGGRALTTPMIREMLQHGATLGSHSVSHPYPLTVKKYRKSGPDAYDAYLRKEMGESKRFLESRFKVGADTYSYPGGFFTAEMLPLGKEFGYRFMFTVQPGKVKRSLPDELLPRYMILGNYDKIFEFATTFRSAETAADASGGGLPEAVEELPYPVSPEPGSIVNSRQPEITADLSTVADLDPESLVMRVAGFGEVPANFASESGLFSWKVNRRLRHETCRIVVTWKNLDGESVEKPLRWSFTIDRAAAYLPDAE